MMPAANGAAADVPVWLSVQVLFVSVVALKEHSINRFINLNYSSYAKNIFFVGFFLIGKNTLN